MESIIHNQREKDLIEGKQADGWKGRLMRIQFNNIVKSEALLFIFVVW